MITEQNNQSVYLQTCGGRLAHQKKKLHQAFDIQLESVTVQPEKYEGSSVSIQLFHLLLLVYAKNL